MYKIDFNKFSNFNDLEKFSALLHVGCLVAKKLDLEFTEEEVKEYGIENLTTKVSKTIIKNN